MRTYQAIIVAGALIAISSGGAIMLTNRYEVSQPFEPSLFKRLDRWTGRVELCSSLYDEKTYCGSELSRRADEAVKADHVSANNIFLSFGYTQEEIDRWPTYELGLARNLVMNGGSKADLAKFWNERQSRR
jgi:hypothetical protein